MIRKFLIDLGVYIEITPEEMQNVVDTTGKRFDFRMRGKYYTFNKHPVGIR